MQQLNQELALASYNFSFAYADNTLSAKKGIVEALNASGIAHAENGEYNRY